jgi:hypothetical protein
MDLTRSAMEYISELSDTKIIEIGGHKYADGQLKLIPELRAETVAVSTLSGLTELIIAEKENFESPLIVQVTSSCTVAVRSALNVIDRSREVPFEAAAETPSLTLNNYLSVEEMLIQLKSRFVQTEDRDKLVSLLGNITEDNARDTGDDGFAQSVVVRKGISMKESAQVPSIVNLAPYRTFTEIEQPASDFLVRVQNGPRVALYEADGGAWKKTAMDEIKAYLDAALVAEDGIIVVA